MQVRLEGANNTQIGFSNGIAVVGVKDGITEVKIPEKFNDLDIVSVSSDIFNSTLKTFRIFQKELPISIHSSYLMRFLYRRFVWQKKIRLMLPWMGCFLQKI